tara:strand:- start:186 stop:881 length:696 start_codon:yes stop_codon:yes gene_type:complete
MRDTNKTIIALIILAIILIFTPSCTKQYYYQSPCINGDCEANYTIVYKNQEILPNSNGHYIVEWDGLNYFQVKGQLTELNEVYVINDVPLIEANFDSDYWVVLNNLTFSTPMYSYLGWFNDQTLNSPISFGNYTYTMNDLIGLHPPLNVVGYQIPKDFCTECPYAPTIVGTHSKYNYNPTQNILLDDEMIGDTINIFIETVFNTEGGILYHGYDTPVPKEVVKNQIKVIVI